MGKNGERGWFVVTDLYLINQVKLGLQHPHNICVGGVTVSMVAFPAVDPGSIPGRRTFR